MNSKETRSLKELLKLHDSDRMEAFWSFVTERQNIYWKRKEGEHAPWTKDPILANHFFCNVYRELDRGTRFATDYVMKNSKNERDLVFRVMLYRMFNEPETFKLVEKFILAVPGRISFYGRKAAQLLDKMHRNGHRIFRSAWMTSGANVIGSKARAYCMDMERFARESWDFAYDLKLLNSMEEVWKEVCTIKWFGSFSAYQVVLDLSYRWGERWTDFDTWVYPGPGARLGLMWILGQDPINRKKSGARQFLSQAECETFIKHLCSSQEKYFNQYKLKFKFYEGYRLDIHNIEFSLCEFNKYMRASRGGKKRHFDPQQQLEFTLKLNRGSYDPDMHYR